jgi:hypothetical protein
MCSEQMDTYVICSNLILVIHDNMTNGTNHIVEHVFVDISRSQRCKNATCQNETIIYIEGLNRGRKEKHKTPSDELTTSRSKSRCSGRSIWYTS